jgi:cytochrome oxidase Cu insertion factor (SCO1/SenC/PrrC family)
MKRPPLTVLLAFVLVGLVAAGALWRLGDVRSQSATAIPDATPVQPAELVDFGGPFSLTDQDGMRRTDMDFRGKYMLIFFGYTFCPDVCPTTLAVEVEALDSLGERANRIVPIFITVDPKRDTPEKLKSYLSAFEAKPPSTRPNFIGLTGTDEEIEKAADAYEVYYQAHLDARFGGDADYSVDHTGNVYLMSPEGKFVAYYSQGISPDELAADLMMRIASPG